MSIRTKLIILLVVASVAPIIIGTWIERRSIERLGDELTARSEERLVFDQKNFMVLSAGAYAATIENRGTELEYAAEVLAIAARELLSKPPAQDARPVYNAATDFNPQNPTAPGVKPRERTFDLGPGIEPFSATLPPASFEAHSTLITPLANTNPDYAQNQAARLAELTPTFQALLEDVPVAFNAYVSLWSGVHATYPGHGRYDPAFNPQERPWWRAVEREFETIDPTFPSWSNLVVDMSTGILTISVAQPIIDERGTWLGVAVIDTVVSDLLAGMPETDWADQTGGYIVIRPEQSVGNEADDTILRIAAREMVAPDDAEDAPTSEDLVMQGMTWDTEIQPEPFTLKEPEVQSALAFAMDKNASNVTDATLENGQRVILAYTPFRNNQRGGDLIYLLLTVPVDAVRAPADEMTAEFSSIVNQQITRNGVLAVIFLIAVTAIGIVISRQISEPIRRLAATADKLAEGDLSATADIRESGEIGTLARTFNHMVPRLQDHLRLQRSVALAQDVQQHLLPHNPPTYPGFDIAGTSDYCDETGGDYFDYIKGPNGELAIALGDVTGHGIASALLMTTARALLRSAAATPATPAQQLNTVNEHLVADTADGRFMTLFHLTLNTDRSITWAAAGHDPAIVYNPTTDQFSELQNDGIPLGVSSDWTYTQAAQPPLPTGAVIAIGTDGIWEAFNTNQEQFGKHRLRDTIKANSHLSARAIADAILNAVDQFTQGAEQLDDITVVIIKVTDETHSPH